MSITFDQKERLHLAIHASKQGQKEVSIRLLKEIILEDALNAEAYFLLGAEYVEIKLTAYAIENMEKALQLKPDLDIARLQLAMTYLYQDQFSQVKETLKALLNLDQNNYFYQFAKGIEALRHSQFDHAKIFLEKGIELNNFNQPLNRNMENIINNLPKTESLHIENKEKQSNNPAHFLKAYQLND